MELEEAFKHKQGNDVKPFTQQNLNDMIANNIGDLKVTELAMFANIAQSSYYKIINQCETVKIGAITSLLHTIGLDLYIGRRAENSNGDYKE